MHTGSASSQLQSHCGITYHLMWFCRHLLTVSGFVFQPLGWTPSLIEFHKSMFLICTFAYIVHQLVLSCYAHVLHLFFIIISQFQLQFPLMFLTSVGAFSSFCHADTISHARWCSLLSYVHYWKREMVVVVVVTNTDFDWQIASRTPPAVFTGCGCTWRRRSILMHKLLFVLSCSR